MSTPQTLTAALPPHYSQLDYRQRPLFSPNDRYLPPPRPSSNISNGYHHNIPARPSSNLSNHQLPPPPRPHSGASNGYAHAHGQPRIAAEYAYSNGTTQQSSNEDLRRTASRTSQQQRQLPPPIPSVSRAPAASSQMPPNQANGSMRADSGERGRDRKRKEPVDWVEYFGGKPPAEIIEIHDDDSPAPSAQVHKLPPPTTNGSYNSQHVNKRQRVNGGSGEAPVYSEARTPYSHSNGTSTDSLQATTAPTSLGSQASSGSLRNDALAQTGQKRKRTTRTSEQERKKQEIEKTGPRGYLAEYGEYQPPPKQGKKQRDVVVPQIHDVRVTDMCPAKCRKANQCFVQRHKSTEKIDDDDGHYIVHERSKLGERYDLISLLGQGTFGKVVRAHDLKSQKEVAVKIIRAVPKVWLISICMLYTFSDCSTSIVMLVASSYECFKHCAPQTKPTGTDAYNFATASTGEVTSA